MSSVSRERRFSRESGVSNEQSEQRVSRETRNQNATVEKDLLGAPAWN